MQQDNIPLPDLAATEALAKSVAAILRMRDVVALSGDLGSGKTTFARALLQARGVTCDVPSPTFTLLQSYEIGGLLISHFDLYRLKSADELDEIGWDDALADGAVMVEWAERAANRLPQERLELHFSIDAVGAHHCRVEKHGSWVGRF